MVIEASMTIQDTRNSLQKRGEILHIKKNEMLLNSTEIPDSFNFKILCLIRDIINHDLKDQNSLDNTQRKSNLSNIALSASLLTDKIKKHYDSNIQNRDGNNIWRDLKFLIKYNLSLHSVQTSPIHQISDQKISIILQDCHNHLLPIVEAETAALQQHYQQSSFDLFDMPNRIQECDQIRSNYKDNRQINELYLIVTYTREIEQLTKAIEAAQFIININAPISSNAKKAILYNLILIGEAFTKKNLSPETVNFEHWNFVANNLRQLLITTANKLTHNEWDIHRGNIDNYLNTSDFINLKAAIPSILNIFNNLKTQLENIPKGMLAQHYTSNTFPHGATTITTTTPPLDALNNLTAGLTTQRQGNQDRQNHTNSFSNLQMYIKIEAELENLNEILFNLDGFESLYQEFPEDDKSIILNNDAIHFLKQKYNDVNIDDALNSITSYHQTTNTPSILEFPGNLIPIQLAIAGRNNQRQISTDYLNQIIDNNPIAFKQAIIAQKNKYQLYNALLQDKEALDALFFHFGRIIKFMQEIDKHQMDMLLGNMRPREYTAFRNFIRHGHEMMDILNIRPEVFLVRYIALIKDELLNLLEPLRPQLAGVIPLHNI